MMALTQCRRALLASLSILMWKRESMEPPPPDIVWSSAVTARMEELAEWAKLVTSEASRKEGGVL